MFYVLPVRQHLVRILRLALMHFACLIARTSDIKVSQIYNPASESYLMKTIAVHGFEPNNPRTLSLPP